MLQPIYLRSFEKEIARDKKRGKDLSKLRKIMDHLLKKTAAPSKKSKSQTER
jgi:hypothetical protein